MNDVPVYEGGTPQGTWTQGVDPRGFGAGGGSGMGMSKQLLAMQLMQGIQGMGGGAPAPSAPQVDGNEALIRALMQRQAQQQPGMDGMLQQARMGYTP